MDRHGACIYYIYTLPIFRILADIHGRLSIQKSAFFCKPECNVINIVYSVIFFVFIYSHIDMFALKFVWNDPHFETFLTLPFETLLNLQFFSPLWMFVSCSHLKLIFLTLLFLFENLDTFNGWFSLKAVLLLPLRLYHCKWTVSPRANHPPISQYFGIHHDV